MEILDDLVAVLHSIVRTTLPNNCKFVYLSLNKDLNIVLNNVSYFAIYIAFIFGVVQAFFSRVEVKSGKRFEKCFLAMVSMVFAISIWPILLFLTEFFTCGLYPWTTAVIVLLMNTPSNRNFMQMLCFNMISLSKYFIKISFSSRTVNEQTYAFTSSAGGMFSIAKEHVTNPTTTPCKIPTLLEENVLETSESPTYQSSITPSEQYGSILSPLRQSELASGEPTISLNAQSHCHLGSNNPSEPFETSAIHCRKDDTALCNSTTEPQPHCYLGHASTHGESEIPSLPHQMDVRESYITSKATQMLPQSLPFKPHLEETSLLVGNSDLVGAAKENSGCFEISRNSSAPRTCIHHNKYKDFTQQVDLMKKRTKSTAPRKSTVRKTKKDDNELQDLLSDQENRFCERCEKLIGQPSTTRAGTIICPTDMFCKCTSS